MMLTKMDEPAETALTPDELDVFMRRGAARVVVERDSPQGGVTAIGVQLRRGEPPFNLLLFRVTSTKRPHDDNGRTIPHRATLEMASPAQRAAFIKRIADRIEERHEDLPPNDNEAQESIP